METTPRAAGHRNQGAAARSQQATFKALPPRSRHDVFMQIELEQTVHEPLQQEAKQKEAKRQEKSYNVTFFGGIYPFRELFDDASVQGDLLTQPDRTKNQYVRHLRVTSAEDDKDRLTTILDEVLQGMPVYLIDQTEQKDDELIAWLLRQPSIQLAERSMPSR